MSGIEPAKTLSFSFVTRASCADEAQGYAAPTSNAPTLRVATRDQPHAVVNPGMELEGGLPVFPDSEAAGGFDAMATVPAIVPAPDSQAPGRRQAGKP